MTYTTTDTAAQAAYEAQEAANGIATVAGNIARLRDLTDDPEQDARYRHMLAELGAISADVRKLATREQEPQP